ncbi:MAG: ArgE/DapE family deacylase [Lentisphaeria bacterium]|nr:ArgE/DapE family deacylase [Lentisphaeria bacterium]
MNAEKILADLISIPSVNPFTSGETGRIYSEQDIVAYIKGQMISLGMDVQIIDPDSQHPCVTGVMNFGAKETILFDAHLDTVSHLGMVVAPFDPVIKDDRMYGRGSCDTKSNMALYLSTLGELLAKGKKPQYNVIITGCSDEEFRFGGIQKYIDTGVKADFAIVGEPTGLNALSAHKGVFRCIIHTRGVACHSSTPEQGHNAIYDIAQVSLLLKQYQEDLKQKVHPILGSPTINVGNILGGTTVNTVPAAASIEIDRRMIPGETPEEVQSEIQRYVEQVPGAWLETPYLKAFGYHTDQTKGAADLLSHACSCQKHKLEFFSAPFATHAPFYENIGIPAIVWGPGSIDKAHSKDEFLPLNELKIAQNILKNLLLKH